MFFVLYFSTKLDERIFNNLKKFTKKVNVKKQHLDRNKNYFSKKLHTMLVLTYKKFIIKDDLVENFEKIMTFETINNKHESNLI